MDIESATDEALRIIVFAMAVLGWYRAYVSVAQERVRQLPLRGQRWHGQSCR